MDAFNSTNNIRLIDGATILFESRPWRVLDTHRSMNWQQCKKTQLVFQQQFLLSNTNFTNKCWEILNKENKGLRAITNASYDRHLVIVSITNHKIQSQLTLAQDLSKEDIFLPKGVDIIGVNYSYSPATPTLNSSYAVATMSTKK